MDRLTSKKGKIGQSCRTVTFRLYLDHPIVTLQTSQLKKYVNYLAKNAAVFVTLKTERNFTQNSKDVGIFCGLNCT